jgi:hypothetical protein
VGGGEGSAGSRKGLEGALELGGEAREVLGVHGRLVAEGEQRVQRAVEGQPRGAREAHWERNLRVVLERHGQRVEVPVRVVARVDEVGQPPLAVPAAPVGMPLEHLHVPLQAYPAPHQEEFVVFQLHRVQPPAHVHSAPGVPPHLRRVLPRRELRRAVAAHASARDRRAHKKGCHREESGNGRHHHQRDRCLPPWARPVRAILRALLSEASAATGVEPSRGGCRWWRESGWRCESGFGSISAARSGDGSRGSGDSETRLAGQRRCIITLVAKSAKSFRRGAGNMCGSNCGGIVRLASPGAAGPPARPAQTAWAQPGWRITPRSKDDITFFEQKL